MITRINMRGDERELGAGATWRLYSIFQELYSGDWRAVLLQSISDNCANLRFSIVMEVMEVMVMLQV